ncbi:MAG: hypothetical protein ABEJ40_01265 [Haloarculaceae archaeon]
MTNAPRLHRDDRAGVERVAVWLVALLVVGGVAGSVVAVAGDVRRPTPDAAFAVAFDAENGTVTVEHAGGQRITDRTTRRLAVVLTDASADATAEVVWASDPAGPVERGTGYPVEAGDALAIDDPRVDADGDGNYLDAAASVGFHLAANDSVRVVWAGNRRGGATRTATLANATLG